MQNFGLLHLGRHVRQPSASTTSGRPQILHSRIPGRRSNTVRGKTVPSWRVKINEPKLLWTLDLRDAVLEFVFRTVSAIAEMRQARDQDDGPGAKEASAPPTRIAAQRRIDHKSPEQ